MRFISLKCSKIRDVKEYKRGEDWGKGNGRVMTKEGKEDCGKLSLLQTTACFHKYMIYCVILCIVVRLARPSVYPSAPYGLVTRKQKR